METLTLNRRDVAQRVKRAYVDGRLSAQSDAPRCVYRNVHDGTKCAIGEVLPDAWADALDGGLFGELSDRLNGQLVGDLLDAGLVVSDDPAWLKTLQSRHDMWASARRCGTSAEVSDSRGAFLKHLKLGLAE